MKMILTVLNMSLRKHWTRGCSIVSLNSVLPRSSKRDSSFCMSWPITLLNSSSMEELSFENLIPWSRTFSNSSMALGTFLMIVWMTELSSLSQDVRLAPLDIRNLTFSTLFWTAASWTGVRPS